MKRSTNKYIGKWRILEMENWDKDFIDLVVPGHITFQKEDKGLLQFGAVECDLDCRIETIGGTEIIAFSFIGEDEGDEVCGRGWATIEGDQLKGRIFFHFGDESGFVAKKS
jgi:hypothetical protein